MGTHIQQGHLLALFPDVLAADVQDVLPKVIKEPVCEGLPTKDW